MVQSWGRASWYSNKFGHRIACNHLLVSLHSASHFWKKGRLVKGLLVQPSRTRNTWEVQGRTATRWRSGKGYEAHPTEKFYRWWKLKVYQIKQTGHSSQVRPDRTKSMPRKCWRGQGLKITSAQTWFEANAIPVPWIQILKTGDYSPSGGANQHTVTSIVSYTSDDNRITLFHHLTVGCHLQV